MTRRLPKDLYRASQRIQQRIVDGDASPNDLSERDLDILHARWQQIATKDAYDDDCTPQWGSELDNLEITLVEAGTILDRPCGEYGVKKAKKPRKKRGGILGLGVLG